MGRILSTIFADHFSNPTKPEARRRKQAQAPRLETLSIAWDGNNGFRRCWRLGWSRRGSASAVSWSLPRARARRVRFGPPDRLSPLGEVYLQPTLTTGHWPGEGGRRERGGEKMVWEPDRFNARVAHRLFMTARSKRRRARPTKGSPQKRPPTRPTEV